MAKPFTQKYTNHGGGISHIRLAGRRVTLCNPVNLLSAAQLLVETENPIQPICGKCWRLWNEATPRLPKPHHLEGDTP